MKDSKDVANYIVEMTRHWFEKYAGYSSLSEAQAVIGISGGKDSSIVATILCRALGPEKVHGIRMPNGEQSDMKDSIALVAYLDINDHFINIGPAYRWIVEEIAKETGKEATPQVRTNLPARLRMSTLYAMAQSINGRVIGTGNWSESMLGWTTLWGDSACDFNPIGHLYVDEVIAVGEALGLPDRFTHKPPSDGMCGKTDEESLGFTYADFKQWDIDGTFLDQDLVKRIREKVDKSRPKRKLLRGIQVIPFHRVYDDQTRGEIDLKKTKKYNSEREFNHNLW